MKYNWNDLPPFMKEHFREDRLKNDQKREDFLSSMTQLYSLGKISTQSMLEAFGLDLDDELDKIRKEFQLQKSFWEKIKAKLKQWYEEWFCDNPYS